MHQFTNYKCANETFQHKRHLVPKCKTVSVPCSRSFLFQCFSICTQPCLNTNKQSHLFYYCTWIIERRSIVFTADCRETDRQTEREEWNGSDDSGWFHPVTQTVICIPKDDPSIPGGDTRPAPERKALPNRDRGRTREETLMRLRDLLFLLNGCSQIYVCMYSPVKKKLDSILKMRSIQPQMNKNTWHITPSHYVFNQNEGKMEKSRVTNPYCFCRTWESQCQSDADNQMSLINWSTASVIKAEDSSVCWSGGSRCVLNTMPRRTDIIRS